MKKAIEKAEDEFPYAACVSWYHSTDGRKVRARIFTKHNTPGAHGWENMSKLSEAIGDSPRSARELAVRVIGQAKGRSRLENAVYTSACSIALRQRSESLPDSLYGEFIAV